MSIKLDKAAFEKIDACFVDILENKDKDAKLKEISTILSTVFDKSFEVTIIKPKRNDPFYIMSIFPEESTLDKLVLSIINEEKGADLKSIWDENIKWYIEIDNRIISGSFVNASSKELTALLLHEIGHVIYSNSVPYRMLRVMKLEFAKADMGIKNVMKSNTVFKQVLKIPIIKACIIDNYKTKENIKRELQADVFAIKMGYGEHLDTVLTKIIAYGSLEKPVNINKTPQDIYDKMKSDTTFSISLIEDLKERKKNVSRENFKKMLIDLPSTFVQNTLGKLWGTLFAAKYEKAESTVESMLMNAANGYYDDIYTTEAFEVFKKKLKRIDPYIPDYIGIRIQDIKSNDDKLMLVSYVHSKLDLVDYYLQMMNDPEISKRYIFKNTKNELIFLRKQLEKLRVDIMKFKIPILKYGINIQYPNGYYG